MAKEKCDKIILIEAWIAANSGLLARFTTKSRIILAIFTRHLSYAEVSHYQK
ncbi:hypothetical protein SPONN_992 [uncultured Candidatus Thioglobus sp.]|nr:hypothetical protein SPONN_992 [uncultured Candidatus Thioglobus sp.]